MGYGPTWNLYKWPQWDKNRRTNRNRRQQVSNNYFSSYRYLKSVWSALWSAHSSAFSSALSSQIHVRPMSHSQKSKRNTASHSWEGSAKLVSYRGKNLTVTKEPLIPVRERPHAKSSHNIAIRYRLSSPLRIFLRSTSHRAPHCAAGEFRSHSRCGIGHSVSVEVSQ